MNKTVLGKKIGQLISESEGILKSTNKYNAYQNQSTMKSMKRTMSSQKSKIG
jgi:hypothetical protein